MAATTTVLIVVGQVFRSIWVLDVEHRLRISAGPATEEAESGLRLMQRQPQQRRIESSSSSNNKSNEGGSAPRARGHGDGTHPNNEEIKAKAKESIGSKRKFSTTSRGFDAPSMQMACDLMFPLETNTSLRDDPTYWSFAEVWDELGPLIRNTTYHHYPQNHPVDYARIGRYRRWVDHLFAFHTAERMRRSQAYPAPSESVRRILEVVQRRIQDPVNNEPVRILFMGGSVATGRDCEVNPLELPRSKLGELDDEFTQRWCSYTSRLEFLLNSVLFPTRRPQGGVKVRNGRYDGTNTHTLTAAGASDDIQGNGKDYYPVFEVTSVATQFTTSQVGAMALEHWLLPFLEHEPPHIVMSSYSPNDAWVDESYALRNSQQDWVIAARNLRPCDDHLPLVVLADDIIRHGGNLMRALRQTGSLYKTASWHDAMAIMYTNVGRQVADSASNTSAAQGGHPLYGSGHDSVNHPGMGFHIGQGWTLFYNLAEAMHAACTGPRRSSVQGRSSGHQKRKGDNDDATETLKAGGTTTAAKMQFKSLEEPLSMYRGRYRGSTNYVQSDWKLNEEMKARRCSVAGAEEGLTRKAAGTASASVRQPRPGYSTKICPYAWMVNRMTPVYMRVGVKQAIEPVLVENSGWVAVDMPYAGWYTNTSDASFSIVLRNMTACASHLTVLSQTSYHDKEWVGSRMKIEVEIESPASSNRRTAEYFVDGHHDKRDSAPYPHRFRLPGEGGSVGTAGARAGDTLRARFTKIGGTQFKLLGLAVCELLASENEDGLPRIDDDATT
jgi:hypothetical protein